MSALNIVLLCLAIGMAVVGIIFFVYNNWSTIVKIVGTGIVLAVLATACYFLSTIQIPIK